VRDGSGVGNRASYGNAKKKKGGGGGRYHRLKAGKTESIQRSPREETENSGVLRMKEDIVARAGF